MALISSGIKKKKKERNFTQTLSCFPSMMDTLRIHHRVLEKGCLGLKLLCLKQIFFFWQWSWAPSWWVAQVRRRRSASRNLTDRFDNVCSSNTEFSSFFFKQGHFHLSVRPPCWLTGLMIHIIQQPLCQLVNAASESLCHSVSRRFSARHSLIDVAGVTRFFFSRFLSVQVLRVSELRGRWPRLARTAPGASQSEAPSPRVSPLPGPPLLLRRHTRLPAPLSWRS